MGGKPMNEAVYEKVVTDRLVFGKPVVQIASEIERTETSVYAVIKAFEQTRDAAWDQAIAQIANYNMPLSLYEWAAKKLGVELPPSLGAAYEERKARKREYDLQKRQQAEQPKATPAPAPEPEPKQEPKKEDNTGLYLIKLLEAVNRQNELLEQLYDVVIPKWVGDLKDNVNCNSDMLSQSLKRIEDKLDAIKINIRKRGL